MSLDRSLKTGGMLARHRNVLTRAERVGRLTERSNFQMDSSDPLHLPKIANRKVKAGGKGEKKVEGAEAAAGGAPAAGAPGAGAAKAGGAKPAGGKAATPAAGGAGAAKGAAPAKAAAPAAKGAAGKK